MSEEIFSTGLYSSQVVTGNTTLTLKSGVGLLYAVVLANNSTQGVITIYDSLTGSGTQITALQCGSPSGGLLSTSGIPPSNFVGPYLVVFSTGLTVVTTGNTNNNFTVLWR